MIEERLDSLDDEFGVGPIIIIDGCVESNPDHARVFHRIANVSGEAKRARIEALSNELGETRFVQRWLAATKTFDGCFVVIEAAHSVADRSSARRGHGPEMP